MKGKIIIEASDAGVGVDTQLHDANVFNKMQIMNALRVGLQLTIQDIKTYAVAECIGLFDENQQVYEHETSEGLWKHFNAATAEMEAHNES